MPLDIPVACLVVDEIQLCADPERGHVFTDRLLHARGEEETMLLGSDTMRGIIQRFIPEAWFITRPRFSDLAYTGAKKLTRLPRRSAVVGFSAEDVYGIAEVDPPPARRRRGGAGRAVAAHPQRPGRALSVGRCGFPGRHRRHRHGPEHGCGPCRLRRPRQIRRRAACAPLRADEIGQIAGRAGRYMNDGTFGVTAECEPFEDELVQRVETHRYDPVQGAAMAQCGISTFAALPALIESLDAPPPERGLTRARPASDAVALRILSEDDEVAALAASRDAVTRLWDVCQLPDFRKLSDRRTCAAGARTSSCSSAADGVIPDDWLARQIARADVTEGDVATLSGRLAQIRTYTYAAHRPGWTRDGAHWQGETRAVEDRLSDALHERLTQRFIDRRTSVLMKHLREDEFAVLALDEAGGVSIGGEAIGKLEGFRFVPDPRARQGIHGRTLRAAALKGWKARFAARAARAGRAPTTPPSPSASMASCGGTAPLSASLAPAPRRWRPASQMLADPHVKTDALCRRGWKPG